MWKLSALLGRKRQKQETAQEMADRFNREFQERMEREEKMQILPSGQPNPIWYRREISRLSELGRWDQADAILAEGITLCERAGMTTEASSLSKEISALQHSRSVDEIGQMVLLIITEKAGIVQTELYSILSTKDEEVIREACYRLASAGKITRKKNGRTYVLRPVGTN